MRCYEDSVLQQVLDGSYDGDMREVMEHIELCPICRQNFEQMKRDDEFISGAISEGMQIPPANFEHTLMLSKSQSENDKGARIMNSTYKRLAAAAAGLAIIGGLFAFEPVRAMAQDILKIFRVENVETISISESDIYQIERAFNEGNGSVDMQDFGKVDVVSNEEGVTSESISSIEDIKGLMANAKLPKLSEGFKADSEAYLHPAMDIRFELDAAKINEFLEYIGEGALLPPAIDHTPFYVHTEESISYSILKESGGRVSITQTTAPSLEIPSDIDDKALIKSMLSMKLIPEDLRNQLSAIDNLTTTIPVVYNKDKEAMEKMTISGEKAVVISAKDGSYTNISFKKDGYLLFISAFDSITKQELVEIANTLE